MELQTQILFRQNPKSFELLKQNSYYFKYLNRGTIDFKKFNSDMKEKYKERWNKEGKIKLETSES